MKFKNKIMALLAITGLMLSAGFASAKDLKLRSSISIIGDIVTLGDLFENAGASSKIAVFRSPRLGKKGILTAKRIQVAAREHGLNWLNSNYQDKIVVQRQANIISLKDISDRIGEELGNKYPRKVSNSQLVIYLNNKAIPFVMRAGIAPEFDVENIRYDARSRRFSAIITGPVGAVNPKRKTYNGRTAEVIEVPVLIQSLTRGQTIKAKHLETKKVSARRIGERTITEAVDLIGMAARRSLRPNSLIRTSDIEKPKLVKKNTLISVVYTSKILHITFRGRALEDGAYGEVITILNTRSRRTIEATVTGPNVVTAQGTQFRKTASLHQ